MQTKESVKRQYELLFELYGVQSGGWSMLHERFNRYVFCEALTISQNYIIKASSQNYLPS